MKSIYAAIAVAGLGLSTASCKQSTPQDDTALKGAGDEIATISGPINGLPSGVSLTMRLDVYCYDDRIGSDIPDLCGKQSYDAVVTDDSFSFPVTEFDTTGFATKRYEATVFAFVGEERIQLGHYYENGGVILNGSQKKMARIVQEDLSAVTVFDIPALNINVEGARFAADAPDHQLGIKPGLTMILGDKDGRIHLNGTYSNGVVSFPRSIKVLGGDVPSQVRGRLNIEGRISTNGQGGSRMVPRYRFVPGEGQTLTPLEKFLEAVKAPMTIETFDPAEPHSFEPYK